jgi:predicted enzyme related to lactoylglutathione lyase
MTFEFILYVKDQQKSTEFYTQLLDKKPILNVPGMTEFKLNEYTKLGLMPEKGIEKILKNLPKPSSGNGIPRCELYINVDNVINMHKKAIFIGAKEICFPKNRNWGDFVSYVCDYDGNVIAFAQKIIKTKK